jgi:hypothetical protein
LRETPNYTDLKAWDFVNMAIFRPVLRKNNREQGDGQMKTDKNFPFCSITFGFLHANLNRGYGKENLKLRKFPHDLRFLPCKSEYENCAF